MTSNSSYGFMVYGSRASLDLSDSIVSSTPGALGRGGIGGVVTGGGVFVGSGVEFSDNWSMGLYADAGCSVRLSDSTVLRHGWEGIGLYDGAEASLVDLRIEAANTKGLAVYGSSVELDDVTVAATVAGGDGLAFGITSEQGSSLTGQGVAIEDTPGLGLYVSGEGSSAALQDSTVSGTLAGEGGDLSAAVYAYDGASIELSDSVLSANEGVGLFMAGGEGALSPTVQLDRVQILDSLRPEEACLDEQGLYCALGAWVFDGSLQADELQILGGEGLGLVVTGESSSAQLSDLTVSEQSLGGLWVEEASQVELSTALLEDNLCLGVLLHGEGTSLTATDLGIQRSRACAAGGLGTAIEVGAGAVADLSAGGERSRWEGNSVGFMVSGPGAELTVSQLDIADSPGGFWGQEGLNYTASVQSWGRLVAQDLALLGCAANGLYLGPGAEVQASDLRVEGAQHDGVVESPAAIYAVLGSSLELERASLVDNEGLGLLAWASDVSCSDCTVQGNRYAGLALQDLGLGDLAWAWCWDPDAGGPIACVEDLGECADLELCVGSEDALAMQAVISDSAIGDTSEAPFQEGGGLGLLVDARGDPVSLELSGSAVQGNALGAVYLGGPGSYSIQECELEGGVGTTIAGATAHGNAVLAAGGIVAWSEDDGQGLLLRENLLHGSAGTGAVFLDRSSARLEANSFEDNSLDLRQQGCSEEVESPPPGSPDDALLCPEYDEPFLEPSPDHLYRDLSAWE